MWQCIDPGSCAVATKLALAVHYFSIEQSQVIKLTTTEFPQNSRPLICQWPYINQFSSLPPITLMAYIKQAKVFGSATAYWHTMQAKQIYFQVQFPMAICSSQQNRHFTRPGRVNYRSITLGCAIAAHISGPYHYRQLW